MCVEKKLDPILFFSCTLCYRAKKNHEKKKKFQIRVLLSTLHLAIMLQIRPPPPLDRKEILIGLSLFLSSLSNQPRMLQESSFLALLLIL